MSATSPAKPEPKPVEVGTVLSGTWGHEQTNASFFLVESVSVDSRGVKWAWLQRLKTLNTWVGDTMTGHAIPGDPETEPRCRRKVTLAHGRYVCDAPIAARSSTKVYASPWDGSPVRVTCYA